MASEFAGSYQFESDDGKFGECLKAMGVGMMARTAAVALKPSVHITVADDGTITVETKSTFKNSAISFKLDQEFEETRMDDVKCKSVVTKDGNKLIHKQASDPPVEIVREFVGDKMVTTCKCGDVVCVRTYKKK